MAIIIKQKCHRACQTGKYYITILWCPRKKYLVKQQNDKTIAYLNKLITELMEVFHGCLVQMIQTTQDRITQHNVKEIWNFAELDHLTSTEWEVLALASLGNMMIRQWKESNFDAVHLIRSVINARYY